MSTQQHHHGYANVHVQSPSLHLQQRALEHSKTQFMEIETLKDRSQREQSVLSGMSIEDMEAAETLNSLHKEFHSPKVQQAPPTHIETTTSYTEDQPEPILSLVTAQYPLAGAVINGSLSAYKTTQSYIPGAEWTERNVGLPIAGKVARISGVEGGLRWALQSKRETKGQGNGLISTPDIEKGYAEVMARTHPRRGSEASFAESLPAYDATGRSPPYEQQASLTRDRQPPPGWRQQFLVSTSGLGIAMSEESLRSLRYCLSWLKWANDRLGGSIQSLKDLVQQRNEEVSSEQTNTTAARDTADRNQAALSVKIAALKTEVLQTLKQVVNVVSTYAGGALPDNARRLVHTHLTSLPQRFSIASAMSHSNGENSNDTANSANRVMVLAQEGLDMMTQVSRVVNDTLVSAEGWCEKLGRRTGQHPESQQHQSMLVEKNEEDRSVTLDREANDDMDVKMEM